MWIFDLVWTIMVIQDIYCTGSSVHNQSCEFHQGLFVSEIIDVK